jgi:hypothetical protein
LLRIHVSEPLWRELFQKLTFDREVHRNLFGIPIFVDTAYQADWWSEHYKEKVIFHMGDRTMEIHNFADFASRGYLFDGRLADPEEVIKSLDAIDGVKPEK